VVTAPQKCLAGTPGLSLLHVSEAALAHMAANPAAPRGSALSMEPRQYCSGTAPPPGPPGQAPRPWG
jgi:aspartate aminotransferase-like enzyme